MKVLYNWLKEFVDFPASPDELRTRLSLAGIAVDAIEDSSAGPALDAEITSNRPDCLGHYGIAREAATLWRQPLKPIDPRLKESPEKATAVARVDIDCPELCGRFTARIIRGVRLAPSPGWLRQRLEALGQASINNVVDVSNYVMFELGHPTHAYDLDRLPQRRIVVRRARRSEKVRTLDGVERTLAPEMCVITDGTHPIGVGGVMGDADTEISSATANVLLESAWFDPISIRCTSKALGLRTEASIRFERGADPEMAETASRRCAELIQQLAGGEILAGVVDVYPRRVSAAKIGLTRKEFLRVMGADVPDHEIEAILTTLGFAPQRLDRSSPGSIDASWACTRPSWRPDVSRPIDLVEEIARHYGFEKFPARLPAAKQPAARLAYAEAEDRLRERLVALGYQEIVTIPLTDPAKDELFRAAGLVPLRIANPLAEDAATLRSSGVVNMLEALEWNLNRGERNLRLFEIGKRYELRRTPGAHSQVDPEGRLTTAAPSVQPEPVETRILTFGATGLARLKNIHEQSREFVFADLKGDLDQLMKLTGGGRWEVAAAEWLDDTFAARLYTPNDSTAIGWAGQLGRQAAERFKLRQDVFLAELDLALLYDGYQKARASLRYHSLPRFPAVERDFSLLLTDGVSFAQVADAVRSLEIPELVRIEPIDLFRGGQIPPGKYSLLVRVTFQSASATLTEAQLTDFSNRIVRVLEQQLGATLRA